jgi:fatty acid desaturase
MAEGRIDWYRTPLEAGTLRRLTERSDARGLVQSLAFLAVFLGTTALCLWLWKDGLWLPLVLACWLHSTFLFLLSMAAGVHELSHGTAFRTKWLNEVFYKLFCFLTWNNPVHFRASHTFHHQATVHRGVDLEVIQGPVAEKLNARNLFLWFTFDAPWFWVLIKAAIRHALGDGDAEYFFWKPLFAKDDPRRKAMIRWARFMVLGHILLAAIFVWFQIWILLYLVTFGSFFATWLGKLFGALQHTGLSESKPDWRLLCHTVELGRLGRFLYWNMNFHIEHHMFAAVPFHRLPELHALVAYDYPVPIRGFFAGLKRLYAIRSGQAKDPSYVFVPELPSRSAPAKGKA